MWCVYVTRVYLETESLINVLHHSLKCYSHQELMYKYQFDLLFPDTHIVARLCTADF